MTWKNLILDLNSQVTKKGQYLLKNNKIFKLAKIYEKEAKIAIVTAKR